MIADVSRKRAASLSKRWGESTHSCADDLQSLSSQSVSWEDMEQGEIASHAALALVETLELEFAVVQLNDASGAEISRNSASQGSSIELNAALPQALQEIDRDASPWPASGVFDWQSASGGPAMRIVRIPIGLRDDGWVFASSVVQDFPKDAEFVVLTACANQIADAIRTGRRRQARSREREYFRQYSEHSPDALWVVKVDTMQIEYLSPAFTRIWGKDTDLQLGNISTWSDTILERDRSAAISALNAAARGETIAPTYSIILSKILTRRIRHVLFPIRDDQGRVTHVGGSAEDVTKSTAVQVYVLSNDIASRDHVALLLRTNGFAVKLFTSSRVFLEAAPVLAPGCLILERTGAEAGSLRVVGELKARGIDLPAIVLDKNGGGVGVAVAAMKAGATDWLEAPYDEAELVAAVASALAGIQDQRDADHASKLARSRLADLTPRERQVLLGLVAGETNKQIARELGISPRTVEIHRAHVMERLGARTLSEAVLLAASAGHLYAPPSR